MTERSMFWSDGIGDGGPYSEDQLRLLYDALAGAEDANRGVLVSQGNELDPSSTGNNNIRMATGRAVVDGTLYENDAILDIVTLSPVTGTTGRRLILLKSWPSRVVRAGIISSADGVGAIPALVQVDGSAWMIPIASFTITTGGVIGALTDEREFGGAGQPTQQRFKGSPETVNNNDTLQDDDDLFMHVAANEDWLLEAFLYFESGVTPDIKFAFTAPSGTLRWGISAGSTASASNDPLYRIRTASGSAQNINGLGLGVGAACHVKGTIEVGATPGDLQLQ